jgi:predicted DNA-binding transcriptional regulator AlpA
MPHPQSTKSDDSFRIVHDLFLDGDINNGHHRSKAGADSSGAVTISAAEMVRLTGVGRERLRTWERRHDFPRPVRCRNNVRRYLADDVRHVIAVCRAVDAGVPLAEAIDQAATVEPAGEHTLESLGATLDHAPSPAIAVSGPEPLLVVWSNGTTRAAPEAPGLGADLLTAVPGFGQAARTAIRRLLIGEGPTTAIITHADWIGTFPAERRSLAWRVPRDVSTEAVVVLLQLPEAAVPHHNGNGLPRTNATDQTAVWGVAARRARQALQQQPGIAGPQLAIAELMRGTGGLDAMLATCHGGTMRTARSVRGTIEPHVFDLAADCDVARALADAEVDWLSEASRRMLGLPARSQAIVVPLIAGRETVGATFLVFADELPLPDITRELLQSLATAIGAVLQRESRAR